jgi:hypothetical protein
LIDDPMKGVRNEARLATSNAVSLLTMGCDGKGGWSDMKEKYA